MKISPLLHIVAMLSLAFFLTLTVQTTVCAKGGGGGGAAVPHSTKKIIGTVNVSQKMIEIKDLDAKTTQFYTIDIGTTITVNDEPGSISSLRSGMEITDYVEKDDHTLNSLTVIGKGKGKKNKS